MKKRALSLLLVLVMVFGLLPVTAGANVLDDGLVYDVYEDHVEITGYTGNATELVIPAEIEGLPVTVIGADAFSYCESLTSIDLPDSITSIGRDAFFACENLSSIDLPASVTYIGDCAFASCESMTTIRVDKNNQNYSSDARGVLFDKEKKVLLQAPGRITDFYQIPAGVTKIYSKAFSNCYNLTDIEIPDGVTEICSEAFSDCYNLTDIELPATVTYIGDSAFIGCESLTSAEFSASLTYIGRDAFMCCVNLADIEIPANVTYIGGYAFGWCYSLTNIYIPASVTEIGRSPFEGCYNLTGIHVDQNNQYYSSDTRGVLFNKQKTVLLQAPGGIAGPYQIPSTVTDIDGSAFSGCVSMTSIDIPASVINIGERALAYCNILSGIHVDENNPNYSSDARGFLFDKEKTVLLQAPCGIAGSYQIPASVTYIGDDAFSACYTLTGIEIPSGVTYIDTNAFTQCIRLTNIKIPASVTYIGDNALGWCEKLTSIYFEGNAPEFGEWSNTFAGVTATAYYPANNPTWTSDVMQDYDGNITWVPYNPNNPFTDVPTDAFYEEPVLWAVENSITTGATADSFNPNGSCLRAHVVTFLHRAAQNPEPSSTNNPFTDVKSSDFFYKPVLWAVEKGITNGTSADQFGSFATCNRAAVVTFLWRAAGSPEPESTENPFVDVKETDFFYKPVLWAIENGITNGVDATHFGPTTACNRAQVVTFLYRAYN